SSDVCSSDLGRVAPTTDYARATGGGLRHGEDDGDRVITVVIAVAIGPDADQALALARSHVGGRRAIRGEHDPAGLTGIGGSHDRLRDHDTAGRDKAHRARSLDETGIRRDAAD